MGTAIAILAGLGLFELWAGRIRSSILVPITVELVMALGFASAWWTDP